MACSQRPMRAPARVLQPHIVVLLVRLRGGEGGSERRQRSGAGMAVLPAHRRSQARSLAGRPRVSAHHGDGLLCGWGGGSAGGKRGRRAAASRTGPGSLVCMQCKGAGRSTIESLSVRGQGVPSSERGQGCAWATRGGAGVRAVQQQQQRASKARCGGCGSSSGGRGGGAQWTGQGEGSSWWGASGRQ